MIYRPFLLGCFSLLASVVTAAGPISNAFSAGFRGVSWTSDCAPDAILPGGKWGSIGPTRYYEILDDQPVFGVQRDRNSSVELVCERLGNGLAYIKIQFPGDIDSYSRLMRALTEAFGKFIESSRKELAADTEEAGFEGAAIIEEYLWPADEDFELRASRATSPGISSLSVSIKRISANTLPRIEIRRD